MSTTPVTSDPTPDSTIIPQIDRPPLPSQLEPLPASDFKPNIVFKQYTCETQLKALTTMIDSELSEPYSIFTYRQFVACHPELCFIVYDGDKCIGGVMSKVDPNKNGRMRGYIGMLVVDSSYRGQRLGSQLVRLTVKSMYLQGIDICLLETECSNHVALTLYENLGFFRTKLLPRYYMNNADAYRLKFWLSPNILLTNFLKQQSEAVAAKEPEPVVQSPPPAAQHQKGKGKGKA